MAGFSPGGGTNPSREPIGKTASAAVAGAGIAAKTAQAKIAPAKTTQAAGSLGNEAHCMGSGMRLR